MPAPLLYGVVNVEVQSRIYLKNEIGIFFQGIKPPAKPQKKLKLFGLADSNNSNDVSNENADGDVHDIEPPSYSYKQLQPDTEQSESTDDDDNQEHEDAQKKFEDTGAFTFKQRIVRPLPVDSYVPLQPAITHSESTDDDDDDDTLRELLRRENSLPDAPSESTLAKLRMNTDELTESTDDAEEPPPPPSDLDTSSEPAVQMRHKAHVDLSNRDSVAPILDLHFPPPPQDDETADDDNGQASIDDVYLPHHTVHHVMAEEAEEHSYQPSHEPEINAAHHSHYNVASDDNHQHYVQSEESSIQRFNEVAGQSYQHSYKISDDIQPSYVADPQDQGEAAYYVAQHIHAHPSDDYVNRDADDDQREVVHHLRLRDRPESILDLHIPPPPATEDDDNTVQPTGVQFIDASVSELTPGQAVEDQPLTHHQTPTAAPGAQEEDVTNDTSMAKLTYLDINEGDTSLDESVYEVPQQQVTMRSSVKKPFRPYVPAAAPEPPKRPSLISDSLRVSVVEEDGYIAPASLKRQEEHQAIYANSDEAEDHVYAAVLDVKQQERSAARKHGYTPVIRLHEQPEYAAVINTDTSEADSNHAYKNIVDAEQREYMTVGQSNVELQQHNSHHGYKNITDHLSQHTLTLHATQPLYDSVMPDDDDVGARSRKVTANGYISLAENNPNDGIYDSYATEDAYSYNNTPHSNEDSQASVTEHAYKNVTQDGRHFHELIYGDANDVEVEVEQSQPPPQPEIRHSFIFADLNLAPARRDDDDDEEEEDATADVEPQITELQQTIQTTSHQTLDDVAETPSEPVVQHQKALHSQEDDAEEPATASQQFTAHTQEPEIEESAPYHTSHDGAMSEPATTQQHGHVHNAAVDEEGPLKHEIQSEVDYSKLSYFSAPAITSEEHNTSATSNDSVEDIAVSLPKWDSNPKLHPSAHDISASNNTSDIESSATFRWSGSGKDVVKIEKDSASVARQAAIEEKLRLAKENRLQTEMSFNFSWSDPAPAKAPEPEAVPVSKPAWAAPSASKTESVVSKPATSSLRTVLKPTASASTTVNSVPSWKRQLKPVATETRATPAVGSLAALRGQLSPQRPTAKQEPAPSLIFIAPPDLAPAEPVKAEPVKAELAEDFNAPASAASTETKPGASALPATRSVAAKWKPPAATASNMTTTTTTSAVPNWRLNLKSSKEAKEVAQKSNSDVVLSENANAAPKWKANTTSSTSAPKKWRPKGDDAVSTVVVSSSTAAITSSGSQAVPMWELPGLALQMRIDDANADIKPSGPTEEELVLEQQREADRIAEIEREKQRERERKEEEERQRLIEIEAEKIREQERLKREALEAERERQALLNKKKTPQQDVEAFKQFFVNRPTLDEEQTQPAAVHVSDAAPTSQASPDLMGMTMS